MIHYLNKLTNVDHDLQAKSWTRLRVGGKPIFTFFPQNIQQIHYFIKNKSRDLKYRTFGAGSNILVSDEGYNGVFIRLHKGLNKINIENSDLIVEAGVNFSQLTKFCIENELGNLEFIYTIPGQIGGLIKMNAGIPEIEIKDILKWVEIINENGDVLRLNNQNCQFGYRSSVFKNNWIITKAAFKKEFKKKEEIKEKIYKLAKQRKEKQPTIGNLAGCFFKNTPFKKAWEIIDKTNIQSFGDTYISNKHKNFIVCDHSLNSKEIAYLIEIIRAKGLYQQQVFLETEVEKIGIW